MPEFLKELLPTNAWMLGVWVVFLLLFIMRSKKIETKWFSWESQLNDPTSEIALKSELLKDYKLLRSDTLGNIIRLGDCYNSYFRIAFIDFMERNIVTARKDGESCKCISSHPSLKTFELISELAYLTSATPMLINMIFRNGFPSLSKQDIDNYQESSNSFDQFVRQKSITVMRAVEMEIDNRWCDDNLDSVEFKRFLHEDTKASESVIKETMSFFRSAIRLRDDFITSIFKDYSKIFKNFNDCQKFCEFYLRDLHE